MELIDRCCLQTIFLMRFLGSETGLYAPCLGYLSPTIVAGQSCTYRKRRLKGTSSSYSYQHNNVSYDSCSQSCLQLPTYFWHYITYTVLMHHTVHQNQTCLETTRYYRCIMVRIKCPGGIIYCITKTLTNTFDMIQTRIKPMPSLYFKWMLLPLSY